MESTFSDEEVKSYISSLQPIPHSLQQSVSNLKYAPDEEGDGTTSAFTCSICLCLLYEPRECSLCTQLFCLECITRWTDNNRDCPNCKQSEGFTPRKISLILVSLMDATKVDGCPNEGCGAQVKKYGQALSHFKKDCPKVQVKCSFEACGQTLVREDAESHLRNNGCKGLLERCGECGTEGAKKAMKEHLECVALVKAKFESVLKEKDLEIERLRGEIQILKSKSHPPQQQNPSLLQETDEESKEQPTTLDPPTHTPSLYHSPHLSLPLKTPPHASLLHSSSHPTLTKSRLEDGDYFGQIYPSPLNSEIIYLIDSKPKQICVVKGGVTIKQHQLQRAPESMLMIGERGIMLVGEENGWIDVARVQADGTLKIFKEIELPEKPNHGIRVTQLLRLDKDRVLVVYYRRTLMILNLNTLDIAGDFEVPQPIPEGSHWPEEVYIKDTCILKATQTTTTLCLAVEKLGIVTISITEVGNNAFTFKHEETHTLEDYSTIYWVGKALAEDTILFLNRDKKVYLYHLPSRSVLKKILITDHIGTDMSYTAPALIPTLEYYETGYPTLYALRDGQNLFLIDLINGESNQIVEGGLNANHSLAQLAVELYSPMLKGAQDLHGMARKVMEGESKREKAQDLIIYTTTWCVQPEAEGLMYLYRHSRSLMRELVKIQIAL
ncbi:hypothetical protein FGO68_gene6700 [Halteria grandinella]|uniref:RING-type domain-containing protein n=1 Tax=Halteria grandinella TaxID=5974 RepID=A0A8J8NWP3_HALGN|nr:hypothetical protein FGO68_gene6700 [Halteria grandinella]